MNKKRIETLVFSTLGVIAMFLLVVAVNFLAGTFKTRVDFTAEKLYTLSEGTRAVLGKLDGTVEVRYYCTRNEKDMPVVLKTYAQRVEDLLMEYSQNSKGNLEIKKYNPEPDSDAEDLASRDGIDGESLPNGEKIYLGLAVSFLDRKVAIPFLAPDKERLLEYELTRAIAGVLTAEKPVIGIMSSIPVFGQPANPMMMRMGQGRGEDPWALVTELQQSFTVEQVDLGAARIDEKIKVLLVIHPKGMTEAAQYAVDQFVLRGGKLIAFVDPMPLVDRSNSNQMMGGMPGMGNGSTMEKLFKAWGVGFDTAKVVADMDNMSKVMRGNRAESAPAFLSLSEDAIDRDDVLTAQLDSLMFPFAGAFTGTPAEGLKKTVLVQSSKNSQLVEGFLAQMSGEKVVQDFKSSDTRYALAIRLNGKFKTAFPEGKPADKPEADPAAEKKDEPKKEDASLKESKTENAVVLVGDVDWVYDQFSVRSQNIMGFRFSEPLNGNLSLVQNTVELFAGDNNLISVRSRASMTRPFTRINKMEAQAESAYQAKIKTLEADLQEAQQKLGELQQNKEKGQRFIMSKEQQAEIEKFRAKEGQVKKELKDVRKQLRHDIESLQFRLKVVNIATMPAIVVLAGLCVALIKRKSTAAR